MKVRGHQLLFKAIVGSVSYGTNIEGSDVDYKGIFIQDPDDVLLNGYLPQIEIGKDETYFEVGRFLDLCQKANPSVLELLFTPEDCIVYKHKIFDTILSVRKQFLTKKCRNSFGGYAVEQIQKAKGLNKKMNQEREKMVRKDVLDFCYIHDRNNSILVREFLAKHNLNENQMGLVNLPHMRNCYAMYYTNWKKFFNFKPKGIADFESNSVKTTSIPKLMVKLISPRLLIFNREDYSSHCKEYSEYLTWLKNRNVQRYVDIEEHGQKIDGKNMLHCIRLIETALEIAQQSDLNVRRNNADYLVSIRKGKVNLEELISLAEKRIKEVDEAFKQSFLPDEVNTHLVKSLLVTIRLLWKKQNTEQDNVAY